MLREGIVRSQKACSIGFFETYSRSQSETPKVELRMAQIVLETLVPHGLASYVTIYGYWD